MGLSVRWICAPAALALGLAVPLHAQDPDPSPAGDEIVVTGVRTGMLDLKRLLRAQAIFRNGRAAFAPTSTLLFQLRPAAGVTLAGMTLHLRNGVETLPVGIDGDGRFSLPDLPPGDWALVHNRRTARIAVRALVLSAGAAEADRPLGDLRLQCRVGWELKKSSYSFMARGGFDAIGGCGSSRIAFYFETLHPISAVSLTQDTRILDLPLRQDRKAYLAPLADTTLANTARIHVRYS